MELTKTSGAPIVRIVNGVTFTFPRLRLLSDLSPMLSTLQAADRDRLMRSLNDARVPADQRIQKMIEFDREAYPIQKGLIWAFTPEGVAQTLLKSLQRATPSATMDDVDALPMPIDELRDIALELWGAAPRMPKQDDADNETSAEANPTKTTT